MILNTGLNSLKSRDIFKGDVKIIKKSKPGPVVFIVTNGLGAVEAVKKDSNFNVGDVVYIEGEVNEHKGRLQIELSSIKKSNMDFDTIILEKATPVRKDFSIKSNRYVTMREIIIAIATRIRKAVLEGQPIMIRHHNDSDGIISGLCIEQGCLGLMRNLGIDPRYLLFRSPSKAPFYASGDVFRDLVLSKRFVESDSNIKPLIIVADNGSTPEDAFGLNTLKTLGYEAIVIDHHNPVVLNNGITSVDEFVSLHLNPYKLGLDSKTSAGMLCYEIARYIWEKFENPLFPAVAGISDRCDIPETELYISKTGKTRQELSEIGTAIDYISYQLKHDAGKGVYEELFENFDFVKIVNSEVRKGFETQLQSTLPYVRNQDINGILLSTIDVGKYTIRFTYPAPGLVTSRIHEITAAENDSNAVLTLGHIEDMIIIRANKPVLPVQSIIKNLKQKFPNANVDGGGHEMAGTIRFVPAHKEELLEEIKTMLKNRPAPSEEDSQNS
uniref:DDH domain-containing protein n=1 Tax=candidate division WWE3 bacterium TaxID=2053526 RepID=A0A7C4Y2R8_UNCKA